MHWNRQNCPILSISNLRKKVHRIMTRALCKQSNYSGCGDVALLKYVQKVIGLLITPLVLIQSNDVKMYSKYLFLCAPSFSSIC